jgi:hypothetical protein
VLNELVAVSGDIDDQDIGTIVRLLDTVKECPDFEYSRTLAFDLLGHVSGPGSPVALSIHVLEGPHYHANPAWEKRAQAFSKRPTAFFVGRADGRMRVYDALGQIGINSKANPDARTLALQLLELMAKDVGGDRARPCQQRAAECAAEVRKVFDPDGMLD